MSFGQVAGQGKVASKLQMALRCGHIPPALLFVGPPGVGKRRMAFTFAQALNCKTPVEDACGTCWSCRAIGKSLQTEEPTGRAKERKPLPFNKSEHPDVVEIALEETKSGDLKSELAIEQFRDLKQLAYLRPFVGRRRVFIWNADLMSSDAAHSILKVLEEPPPTTTLVLLSENPDLVLPTIRSRCQTLVFGPVAIDDIARTLCERGLDEDHARVLALVLGGNIDRALDLDPDEIYRLRADVWSYFRGLAGGVGSAAFLRRFAFARRKDVKDDLAEALDLLGAFARDLALLQEGGPGRLLLNPDFEAELMEVAVSAASGMGWRLVAAVASARSSHDRRVQPGLLAGALAARMIG